MVTVSPHFPGSNAYIAELVRRGVHVSLGHTHASAEQIHAAVDAGARLSTHLGNGLASPVERHANPLWPQLTEDRLTQGGRTHSRCLHPIYPCGRTSHIAIGRLSGRSSGECGAGSID